MGKVVDLDKFVKGIDDCQKVIESSFIDPGQKFALSAVFDGIKKYANKIAEDESEE